jgi:hypothetical protein
MEVDVWGRLRRGGCSSFIYLHMEVVDWRDYTELTRFRDSVLLALDKEVGLNVGIDRWFELQLLHAPTDAERGAGFCDMPRRVPRIPRDMLGQKSFICLATKEGTYDECPWGRPLSRS